MMYAKLKHGKAWHIVYSRRGMVLQTTCGVTLKGARVIESEHGGNAVCTHCLEQESIERNDNG